MIASRILLIPVIAAVGYEILRFGARHRAQPDRQGAAVPGHPRPDDHDQAADRRHDRGRHRLDGAGARGRRRDRPGRLRRLRAATDGPGAAGRRRRPTCRAPAAAAAVPLAPAAAEPTRHRGDERPRRQARGGRPPVRRHPGRAVTPRDLDATRPAIRRLGQELSRLEPVVEAFRRARGDARRAGRRARAARRRRRRRRDARRWRARRSTGSRPTRRACSTS